VVADTTCEVAALASVLSVGMVADSHCVGGHDKWGRFFGLCSLGRCSIRQPLCSRARNVMALFWHLFVLSVWAQPATVVAGTTGEGASQASVPSVGVGSFSHIGGGHDS
jgi:hypothetical protein